MQDYNEKIIIQADYLKAALQSLQEEILAAHPEWSSLGEEMQQQIFQPAWRGVVCDFVASVNSDAQVTSKSAWEKDLANITIQFPLTPEMLNSFSLEGSTYDGWANMVTSIVRNRCADAVSDLMSNPPKDDLESKSQVFSMHKVAAFFPGGMTSLAKQIQMNVKTLMRHLRAETEVPSLDFIDGISEQFEQAFPEGCEKYGLLLMVTGWNPTSAVDWLLRWKEEKRWNTTSATSVENAAKTLPVSPTKTTRGSGSVKAV